MFIQTVKPSEASGEVRAMYARQQGTYGYVPNYAQAFSHRPEVLARWGRLLAEIRRPMPDRLFELATMTAAVELNNSACSLAHGQQLARLIGTQGVTDALEGGDSDVLTTAEKVVVRFSRKVARDASSVEQEDIDELREHGYSDDVIFDIVTTVAGRSFLTRICDGLGVLMDSPANKIEEPLRSQLTVGRPISNSEVQRLGNEETTRNS